MLKKILMVILTILITKMYDNNDDDDDGNVDKNGLDPGTPTVRLWEFQLPSPSFLFHQNFILVIIFLDHGVVDW